MDIATTRFNCEYARLKKCALGTATLPIRWGRVYGACTDWGISGRKQVRMLGTIAGSSGENAARLQ